MVEIDIHELSSEQCAVVNAQERFLVVLASAGSGKTEVIAQRIERLLTESSSDFKVVALSYTRRAAAELRKRFSARLHDKQRRVETDTLHGFAQRLLLQYGTWIGLPPDPIVLSDDADRVDLLQTWRVEAGLDELPDARAQLLDMDLCLARGQQHPLIDEWLAALDNAGALDFGAMLLRATELLAIEGIGNLIARIYRHVVVDEAQNLTFAQYQFLKRLLRSSSTMNAALVGDDKQSIVEFAGASVAHLRSFERDFEATTFRLTCNFRSAAAIGQLGDAIARQLNEHPAAPQKYAAAGDVQTMVCADEEAEAAAIVTWVQRLLTAGLPAQWISSTELPHVSGREIAVLARSAAALRACARALQAAGVTVARATHADDWLMSDLGKQAWLLGTFRPQSTVSQRRLVRELGISSAQSVEELRAGVGLLADGILTQLVGHESPSTFMQIIEQLQSGEDGWFEDQQELTTAWVDFCSVHDVGNRSWPQFELFVAQWQRGDEEQQGVRLQTVHKSQGREFKAVAIIGLNDGQFPDFRARTPQALESEWRAFYVAATRASRCLLLTRPEVVMTRNGPWKREESPFFKLALSNRAQGKIHG